jgi:hypothetical protein
MDWVIYYLFEIWFLGIIYDKEHQIIIIIALDILFANDPNIWYFFQNYMVFLFRENVIWKTIYQSIIIILSTETELFIFEFIIKKTIIFKKFFYNFILFLNNL